MRAEVAHHRDRPDDSLSCTRFHRFGRCCPGICDLHCLLIVYPGFPERSRRGVKRNRESRHGTVLVHAGSQEVGSLRHFDVNINTYGYPQKHVQPSGLGCPVVMQQSGCTGQEQWGRFGSKVLVFGVPHIGHVVSSHIHIGIHCLSQ